MNRVDYYTNVMKALANRNRLRIAFPLLEGTICECELVSGLKISQPLAAQHLKKLIIAGVVKVAVKGKWRYFYLNADSVAYDFVKGLYEKVADEQIIKNDAANAAAVKCKI